MYEPLEPPLHPESRNEPQDTHRTPTPQAAQRGAPGTLDRVLRAIHEPALAHREGRIVALNDGLIRMLQHPSPHLLVGLPADALLHQVQNGVHGRVHRASLTTHRGPVLVGLTPLSLDLPEGPGTVWLFGPPPMHGAEPHHVALQHLEALCDRLWLDERPDRDVLLSELGRVAELLAPAEEGVHLVRSDIGALVRVLCQGDVDVRREVLSDVPPDDLTHMLAPALESLPEHTRVRVDLDVSSHPVIILRHDHARLLPDPTALRRLQVLAGNLRGSAVSLEEGRVVRVRLPRPRHDGVANGDRIGPDGAPPSSLTGSPPQ